MGVGTRGGPGARRAQSSGRDRGDGEVRLGRWTGNSVRKSAWGHGTLPRWGSEAGQDEAPTTHARGMAPRRGTRRPAREIYENNIFHHTFRSKGGPKARTLAKSLYGNRAEYGSTRALQRNHDGNSRHGIIRRTTGPLRLRTPRSAHHGSGRAFGGPHDVARRPKGVDRSAGRSRRGQGWPVAAAAAAARQREAVAAAVPPRAGQRRVAPSGQRSAETTAQVARCHR